MKKIWFMLLLICSACAFTACSDDDEKTPEAVIPTATMPEKISIGKEVTITGKNFDADHATLILKNETETVNPKKVTFTVTSVTFTLPANTKAGSYQVIVNQNDKDYLLGNVEVSDFPITDLLMPSKTKTGEKVHLFGEGFTESDKLILQSSSEQKIEIGDADFNDKEASFTLSYAFMAGNYSLLLIQNEKEYKLGELEIEENSTIITPITKRISKITYTDAYGSSITWTLNHNGEHLNSIHYLLVGEGESQEMTYNINYEENQIFISDEDEYEMLEYTLSENKIESSINSYELPFQWTYNDAYLSKIIGSYEDEEEGTTIEFSSTSFNYDDNKDLAEISITLEGEQANYKLNFKNSSLKNISKDIDPIICIYKYFIQTIDDNHEFFPHLMGICGDYSANLPVASDITYGNTPFQYVVGMWGIMAINYDDGGDVSTISFEYED